MSTSKLEQTPAVIERPDTPLEVQYSPPPGPPPLHGPHSPTEMKAPAPKSGEIANIAGQTQDPRSYETSNLAFVGQDEKEVVGGGPVSQPRPSHSSASALGQGDTESLHQEHSGYTFQVPGAVPYFPSPSAQAVNFSNEQEEAPPPMPPRPVSQERRNEMPRLDTIAQDAVRQGLIDENSAIPEPARQATSSPGTPSTKEQEHELHKDAGVHEAPPPYTLQDEGLYDAPKLARPAQRQSPVDHAAKDSAERTQASSPSRDLAPPLPPRPRSSYQQDDEISNPIHYTRDPHRLIGYLVPFPKPRIPGVSPDKIPTRFLIYTPPPPPLQAPPEGAEESRINKIQRKWQNEVRQAKQSDAKLASWKGVKSRATRGISWAMGAVKSAELEFLTRVPAAPSARSRSPSPLPERKTPGDGTSAHDAHADDGEDGSDHRTVGLEALDLVYPTSLGDEIPGGEPALRAEFINTMMRTRSKAQKDAVIATGLLPVSAAIDILATVIWPFGGLLEVDGVWAYASIRGAKTARSVTKRLASSTNHDTHIPDNKQDTRESLALRFIPSGRLEVLRRYLAAKCVERDRVMFSGAKDGQTPATESTVLGAIGWAPSQGGGETRNWEDEQWETQEVKEDLKMVFGKAAKSWDKWCKGFEKNPEKAVKR